MGRSRRLLPAAAALLSPAVCAAAPVQPMRWSLPAPLPLVAASATGMARSFGAAAATFVPVAGLPRYVDGRGPGPTGFRLAPMLSNILNSRRVTALEQVGAPGGGEGYLRGIRRTIGVALRKPFP